MNRQFARFFEAHGDVVVKPLYGFFGLGIKKYSEYDHFKEDYPPSLEPLMFQRFLPEGVNKRVVMMDGDVFLSNANILMPGKLILERDNLKIPYNLNERDKQICNLVSIFLKKHNIDYAGIDIVGDFLLELNVTCTGSLRTLNKIYNIQSERTLMDIVEAKK